MKDRFRLIYRGERGATFYYVDSVTGKRTSLETKDRDAAKQIVFAKNQALKQPAINLQLAKAYLAGSDSGVATRTWQVALNTIIDTKHGRLTKERWLRAAKDKALDGIRNQVIIETNAENLFEALKDGTVSTNVHLRKVHNFCLRDWLPWPLIPQRQWPAAEFAAKRAITKEEHQLIIGREKNPETRDFYQLCWHLGGSQSDIASLEAE